MYLSRLEILGFKSFAQKTVVNFTHGMTGIVGPNGCGKTNIVDAIRWSLGEQKSSTLRSDKMENVIFNGTANKKPLGMAEVSLTIQNDKGILPSEYSEVVITRRIFRSGESEYLLNKNICRLKDITNLFMDTGMGANAYSVIELKMVESILSSKADDRRTLFEEAAGVNKYKLRRRLTIKKLDEVKGDLTRVNDIVSEVEKKVNSLERQAKKAEKYNKLSITLKELELDLAERELAQLHITRQQQKEIKEDRFSKRLAFESDIARLEDGLQEVKIKLTEVERELSIKRGAITAKTEEVHKVEQSISVARERNKSLEKNITQFERDIEEFNRQLETLHEQIEDYKYEIDERTRSSQKLSAEKDQLSQDIDSKKQNVEEKRELVKTQNNAVITIHRELANRENAYNNLQGTLKRLQSSAEKLNVKIQSQTGNIAKTVAYIEELTQEKTETENRLKDAESEYLSKQEEKQQLEAQLAQLKENEMEERRVLNGIRDKIAFLQQVIDNLEGFSKGAKALLEDASWHRGEKNLLANIGNAEDQFRFAIEAAMKNNLNSIIVDTLDDIQAGIQYLEQNDFGKAAFYLNRPVMQRKQTLFEKLSLYMERRKRKKLMQEEGFMGWADAMVSSEDKWKPFFASMLANIVVVQDLSVALRLSSLYEGYSFTTLNGDFLAPSGLIEGGAAPKLDETLFGRRQMLENLKAEIPGHERHLEMTHAQIDAVDAAISAIDMKMLAEKSRMLVNDLANIEKQIAQFEFEKKKAIDDIEKNRQELQDIVTQFNELDKEREKLEVALVTFREDVQKAKEQTAALETEFRQAESDYSGVVTRLNALHISIERIDGEKKNFENAIVRNEESIVTVTNSIARRKRDIETANEEKNTLIEILEDKDIELHELQLQREKLLSEEKVVSQEYSATREIIQANEKEINTLRKQREQLSNEIHAAEIKLNEVNLRVENLKNHIQENYSIQLELKEYEDLETFDFKQRSDEVMGLKQQIKNLGPVYMLAHSEYEEEKQRLEFLLQQRNDLINSEKDLIKSIEEINTAAQILFMETFEKIRGYFINIFRSLFNPGDEADLKLEENADPLEGKIEIVAKPKGKRPTSIELLSGGEKTLTAIALLFSIYLVKPSPFCILDEIDAPLDDANIDRFTKIIREFSQNTQFIVVTHNKRTMEAADGLYGVTMQEEGISKLVTVRFNEDMNIVA